MKVKNPKFLSIRNPVLYIKENEKLVLDYAFIFFCFFPYISLLPFIKTDTQPYALACSFLYIVAYPPRKVPKYYFILILLCFVSILLLIVSGLNTLAVRNMLGYFGLFTLSYAAYKMISRFGGVPEKFIEYVIYAWLAVGLIQLLIYPKFLSFMLPRASGNSSRGMVGLAPEPSFYGIYCVFMYILVKAVDHPKKKLLGRILIFQIIILAQSAMVILFLLIYFGLSWILTLNFAKTVVLVAGVIASALTLYYIDLSQYTFRAVQMLDRAIDDGLWVVLIKDGSVNDRAAHIFFSFKGAIDNFLFPQGFTQWNDFIKQELPAYRDIFWKVSRGGKIMSTYGAAIFELGIFGFLLPLIISVSLWKLFSNTPQKAILFIVFINIILFTAIPISHPLISILIGYSAFRSLRKE